MHLAHGDRASAVNAWRLAWEIVEPLNHPDLAELRHQLDRPDAAGRA